jgi:hypothetical protein
MTTLKKIWEWLKKNWKWLILPLWVVSMVLVWLFTGGRKVVVPSSGTSDQAANTAVSGVITASDERQRAIADILRIFEERLKKASVDQLKEAEVMKDKPLSEVASWIDKF